jgi:hypothetical protein
MIRITSLRNEKLNIDIPQMMFHSRADNLIDVSGFGRFTEKVIWEAIRNSGIQYRYWAARKEAIGDKPILHLYLELQENYIASEKAVAATIYGELQKLDNIYHYNFYGVFNNPETLLGLKPMPTMPVTEGERAAAR